MIKILARDLSEAEAYKFIIEKQDPKLYNYCRILGKINSGFPDSGLYLASEYIHHSDIMHALSLRRGQCAGGHGQLDRRLGRISWHDKDSKDPQFALTLPLFGDFIKEGITIIGR